MGEAPSPPARAPAPASCSRSSPASIAHLPASTLLHSPPLTYSTASTASYTRWGTLPAVLPAPMAAGARHAAADRLNSFAGCRR